ncbi:unnamed protein product [Lupinus luteus]|uniref:Uncharacterized protein n=1 Tax=Lupinus luteus TaxID=3873 RepID=A0AAV1XVI3_LUPLU
MFDYVRAGCVILYISEGKLYGRTSDTLNYVVNQAQLTAENLNNVSQYLNTSERIGLGANVALLPSDIQHNIDLVKAKITTVAATLTIQTEKTSMKLRQGIDGVGLVLHVVAAVMLFLAFLGLCMFVSLPFAFLAL